MHKTNRVMTQNIKILNIYLKEISGFCSKDSWVYKQVQVKHITTEDIFYRIKNKPYPQLSEDKISKLWLVNSCFLWKSGGIHGISGLGGITIFGCRLSSSNKHISNKVFNTQITCASFQNIKSFISDFISIIWLFQKKEILTLCPF